MSMPFPISPEEIQRRHEENHIVAKANWEASPAAKQAPAAPKGPLSQQVKKHVVGHKIVRVELNRFNGQDGNGPAQWTYNPVIVLDNGVRISFAVDETDSMEYGVYPIVVVPKEEK